MKDPDMMEELHNMLGASQYGDKGLIESEANRKAQKKSVSFDGPAGSQAEAESTALITLYDDEEDDEDDEEFELGSGTDSSRESSDGSENEMEELDATTSEESDSEEPPDQEPIRRSAKPKPSSYSQSTTNTVDPSSAGALDTSEDDHRNSSSISSSSDESSSSGSSSSSESEEDLPNDVPRADLANTNSRNQPKARSILTNGASHKPEPVPPGSGKRTTKSRNLRRTSSKKLAKLKEYGTLPAKSTVHDLRLWQSAQLSSLAGEQNPLTTEPLSTSDHNVQHSLTKPTVYGDNRDSQKSAADEIAKNPRREPNGARGQIPHEESPLPSMHENNRSNSLDDMQLEDHDLGGVVNGTEHMIAAQAHKDPTSDILMPQRSAEETTPLSDGKLTPRTHKQTKLDVASSRRLLFGALGVKTPKNTDEEQQLRKKLATAGKRQPKKQGISDNSKAGTEPELEVTTDSIAWNNKLDVKAVECDQSWIGEDGDDRYSAPPYPFQQLWDPVAQELGNYERSSNTQKRKRTRSQYEDDTEMVEYPDLNYDEVEDLSGDMDENQSPQGTFDVGASEFDDLPPLPDDPSSLPSAELKDMRVGAVIVFKQLEVSAATKWMPTISAFKTALILSCLVESETDAELRLKLAARDWPDHHRQPRKTDESGKPLYEKFEMAGLSDDEEEGVEGILELQLQDLVEPKILCAASEMEDNEGEE